MSEKGEGEADHCHTCVYQGAGSAHAAHHRRMLQCCAICHSPSRPCSFHRRRRDMPWREPENRHALESYCRHGLPSHQGLYSSQAGSGYCPNAHSSPPPSPSTLSLSPSLFLTYSSPDPDPDPFPGKPHRPSHQHGHQTHRAPRPAACAPLDRLHAPSALPHPASSAAP